MDKKESVLLIQKCKDVVLEDACSPNALSVKNALIIFEDIYEKYFIIPFRINPSIEEGITITYKFEKKEMIIETYNNGNVAGIICDISKMKVSFSVGDTLDDVLKSNLLKIYFTK